MKNMWLLVSVILAGMALWLWRKFTPRAPVAALAEVPTEPLERHLAEPLKQEVPPGASLRDVHFDTEKEWISYLATIGKMIAPSGEICDIAYYNKLAGVSPTGVPEQFMRTLPSGAQLLPTGDVRMPSGEIKPMTESLYLAFGTQSSYVKQLEANLGHKLYDLPKVQYMSTSGAVPFSGPIPSSTMVPGTLYVETGGYKPIYHYIDPVTGSEYAGENPPVIKPGYTSYITD